MLMNGKSCLIPLIILRNISVYKAHTLEDVNAFIIYCRIAKTDAERTEKRRNDTYPLMKVGSRCYRFFKKKK